MSLHFTNPGWLWLWPLAAFWVAWLSFRSHASIGPWRRRVAGLLRLGIATLLVLALAGIQRLEPGQGMNAMFLLDRSRSVPESLQRSAVEWVNRASEERLEQDRAGVLVFGRDAGIEHMVQRQELEFEQIQALVDQGGTDISAAVRLAVAALPEHGQKRLVLLSDGNETLGDALAAVVASRPLGVSVDVVPLGSQRRSDVALERLALPSTVKEGAPFRARIFVEADQAGPATVSLYRNQLLLGQLEVELSEGKNQLEFPQLLEEPGFYAYRVEISSLSDRVAENNRGMGFVNVRGDPRILIVSDQPQLEGSLVRALSESRFDVVAGGLEAFPGTLAEMQSYDAIFLCNIAAGDLGGEAMWQLESAVRDFGTGLVCVGGDQAYAAGAYRGTPLERILPVDMELSSKKVMPKGALVLIMHGMEFANGNQVARKVAVGVLEAMGPRDELGVLLWDGTEKWLFPLAEVGDRSSMRQKILGMSQGDLPSFQGLVEKAHQGLDQVQANLKHIIVFSDGDPGRPTQAQMDALVDDRITMSTVLIAGHAGPDTMQWMASNGGGRFFHVTDPSALPRIFIKEAAVILKSAISEEPFVPLEALSTEVVQGLSGYPRLLGHVATSPKARAEIPLVTPQDEPVLAHWNYGVGRAVAFTSDARARWAQEWISWPQFRQFWSQVAQWSLRRVENTDFTVESSIEKGVGRLVVEAIDSEGGFRNFLDLEARTLGPTGAEETRPMRQVAPGRYEVEFKAEEVGAYTTRLALLEEGRVAGYQMVGSGMSHSPEFSSDRTNLPLLSRLAEASGGRFHPSLEEAGAPFGHDRRPTYRPHDLWESLLALAILLLPLDVALRRVQLDREDLARAGRRLLSLLLLGRGRRPPPPQESLSALLRTRDRVRSRQQRQAPETRFSEEELERAQASRASRDPAAGEGRREGPEAPEEPPEQAPEQEATSTGRLLAARDRARRKRGE